MNNCITIDDRERMIVSGVKTVVSVTDDLVSLYTENGDLNIKGGGFEAEEFDPASGIFRVSGRIDSLSFTTDKYHLSDNFLTRLFR